MKDIKNIIIALLTLILIAMGVFFYNEIDELKQTNNMLRDGAGSGRSGGRDKQSKDPYREVAVPNTLRKHAGEVQKCYNSYLATKPKKTDGYVEIDWQINAGGTPTNPETVRASINSPSLNACIISVIRSINFPPPPYKQAAYIVYRYNFKKAPEKKSRGQKPIQ